ncbi:MAG: class I SAM-dependent methyltransferase [Clostridia bacterium]|nr:class I SAM-dependent methyltransferase [Clostridia bacterium]
MKNIFKLSERLKLCVDMVTPQSKVADIGTDHAYIPIWLALNGIIRSALACDIRNGPLENASKNIEKYGLSDVISTRLSDGLLNIGENEADEIIIAGMGGNIISNILSSCHWPNKKDKIFILQPMKYEERLREFLAEHGYKIEKEKATICSGKVYTAMKVIYLGVPQKIENYEKYIGKLSENFSYPAARAYIRKQIKNLQNHLKGAKSENLDSLQNYYHEIIEKLQNYLI